MKIPPDAKRTMKQLTQLRDAIRKLSKLLGSPDPMAVATYSDRQDKFDALTRLLSQIGAKSQDQRDIYDRQYLVPACRAARDRFEESDTSYPCVSLIGQLDQAGRDIDDQIQRLESHFRSVP